LEVKKLNQVFKKIWNSMAAKTPKCPNKTKLDIRNGNWQNTSKEDNIPSLSKQKQA
jgi:hypothetical protein